MYFDEFTQETCCVCKEQFNRVKGRGEEGERAICHSCALVGLVEEDVFPEEEDQEDAYFRSGERSAEYYRELDRENRRLFPGDYL